MKDLRSIGIDKDTKDRIAVLAGDKPVARYLRELSSSLLSGDVEVPTVEGRLGNIEANINALKTVLIKEIGNIETVMKGIELKINFLLASSRSLRLEQVIDKHQIAALTEWATQELEWRKERKFPSPQLMEDIFTSHKIKSTDELRKEAFETPMLTLPGDEEIIKEMTARWQDYKKEFLEKHDKGNNG